MNPISLYGTTKLQAESLVMTHKNSVAFRLATVFGFSYRMRTDLLVNNFVKTAVDKKNYLFLNHTLEEIMYTLKMLLDLSFCNRKL